MLVISYRTVATNYNVMLYAMLILPPPPPAPIVNDGVCDYNVQPGICIIK